MTDTRDSKLTRRYRELGAEEPPRALDQAILAASRRGARPRHGRWLGPVAVAAALVLAIAVTVVVEREAPGDAEAPSRTAAPAEMPAGAAPRKAEADHAPEVLASRDAAKPPATPTPPMPQARALAEASSPEAQLARIVELREKGQHDAADRLLAEFRRRHPDYRIPEETLKKLAR